MTEQQNLNLNSGRQRGVLRVLIAVVVILALAVSGYFSLNFISTKISESDNKAAESIAEMSRLQSKLEQLQSSMQGMQAEIQKNNSIKNKNWKPVVIEYLVRMADLTLNTTGETRLVLSFLTRAEQYASEPELSAIKHALNKDIASLQVVPVIDLEELILKIEGLNQKIGSLPLVAREFKGLPKTKTEEFLVARTLWESFLAKTMTALKDIVSIRHQVVEPLIAPEQEAVLRLNIQTKLLQAELAVMHRQNKLYQSCLEQAIVLISHHFTANIVVKDDVLPVLQKLRQVDLQPQLPSLTESMATIVNFTSANRMAEDKSSRTPQTKEVKGL